MSADPEDFAGDVQGQHDEDSTSSHSFDICVRDDTFSAEFTGKITASGDGASEMVAVITKGARQLTELMSLLVDAAKNEKACRGS